MKDEIINGINYRLDEDKLTAEVIARKEMIWNVYKGDIIIPETVVFNELTYRVESIGEKAFARSYSLKSVTIPDSVTSIGDLAFKDCKELKSIAIPDSVTSIGEYAFAGCESLTTKVVIGEKIIGGIKYRLYCNRTAKIIQKSGGYKGAIIIPETVEFKEHTYRVTSIGAKSFTWCKSLKSIVIPDGVTSIGEQAFNNCYSLTKIAIPNSVTSIGKSAFENCEKLTSITIPDNVKSIGDMTFSSCFALTEIVIPARVTEIGECAFDGCSALTSIIVAEGNPRYDSRMNCNAIIETATNTLIRGCSQTIIPESVTEIGEYAFNDCKSLTSIIIPDNVTSIGAEAFRYCESLKSITIPASVKSIGIEAFDWCEMLNSITFQGSIAQWREIELGNLWNHEVSATVVHCTDGDVEI